MLVACDWCPAWGLRNGAVRAWSIQRSRRSAAHSSSYVWLRTWGLLAARGLLPCGSRRPATRLLDANQVCARPGRGNVGPREKHQLSCEGRTASQVFEKIAGQGRSAPQLLMDRFSSTASLTCLCASGALRLSAAVGSRFLDASQSCVSRLGMLLLSSCCPCRPQGECLGID